MLRLLGCGNVNANKGRNCCNHFSADVVCLDRCTFLRRVPVQSVTGSAKALSMATSAVTLRGATMMLSRSCRVYPLHSATISVGFPLRSSKGKHSGMSIAVTPSLSSHCIGKISRTISSPFPSFNTRLFCASSEVEAPVTEDVTSAPPVPNPDSAVGSPSPASNDPLKDAAGTLDIRVGQIIKVWIHPEADTLYVEEVDVGEPEPRTICSGLVKYIPLESLQNSKVIVLANLKPRNMRGVKSSGMLLCASDASHENVELLSPPEGSVIGERIWFGLEEEKENQSPAASPNQIQKKKIWELVQPHLKTDGSCVAALGTQLMQTSAGVVTSTSLQNANIS
ncbi:hypothetical protein IFM89_038736 [Coptis chinensis]|uniref:tRNA-binding domain-containing protein n=1 Tax=Coptis chinensis TaxID=261450 RepID=A0A835LU16_9MAGN|nr:hypothetical protein IFM89_038736 [Coptis chinensis]